jgi:hypothetical protein
VLVSNLLLPPVDPPEEDAKEFFQKNNSGYVAFKTTGTPFVHVAVAEVAEFTKTLLAITPPNVALAV